MAAASGGLRADAGRVACARNSLDDHLAVVLGDERDRAPADALRLASAAARIRTPRRIAGITIFISYVANAGAEAAADAAAERDPRVRVGAAAR